MTAAAPIIAYEGAPQRAMMSELGVSATSVRANFGVLPRWHYGLQIANCSIYLAKSVVLGAFIFWMNFNFHRQFGTSLLPPAYLSLVLLLGSALLFHGAMLFGIVYPLCRWGRVPRVITTTADALTVSDTGWFKARERSWSRDQIKGIVLSKVRYSRITRRFHCRLRLRLARFFPIVIIPFEVIDAALPARMVEHLAQKLDCPLVTR